MFVLNNLFNIKIINKYIKYIYLIFITLCMSACQFGTKTNETTQQPIFLRLEARCENACETFSLFAKLTTLIADSLGTSHYPYFLQTPPRFDGDTLRKEFSEARGVFYTLRREGDKQSKQHEFSFIDQHGKQRVVAVEVQNALQPALPNEAKIGSTFTFSMEKGQQLRADESLVLLLADAQNKLHSLPVQRKENIYAVRFTDDMARGAARAFWVTKRESETNMGALAVSYKLEYSSKILPFILF